MKMDETTAVVNITGLSGESSTVLELAGRDHCKTSSEGHSTLHVPVIQGPYHSLRCEVVLTCSRRKTHLTWSSSSIEGPGKRLHCQGSVNVNQLPNGFCCTNGHLPYEQF